MEQERKWPGEETEEAVGIVVTNKASAKEIVELAVIREVITERGSKTNHDK